MLEDRGCYVLLSRGQMGQVIKGGGRPYKCILDDEKIKQIGLVCTGPDYVSVYEIRID